MHTFSMMFISPFLLRFDDILVLSHRFLKLCFFFFSFFNIFSFCFEDWTIVIGNSSSSETLPSVISIYHTHEYLCYYKFGSNIYSFILNILCVFTGTVFPFILRWFTLTLWKMFKIITLK